ncbi:MAG: molybdopterin-synthase adenylyltransferase MoeB [Pseudomonadales bacterium]|nr:molybdopterin-synthase adenylyltransferase MoeB [Pseudomonadales bacterium]
MNDEQLLRYSRHIMLPEVDIDGQQKLLNASVLIAGIGGLGSPIALYLAAAGVGHLILADHDQVELSNLQRQIIHDTNSISLTKVESATRRLKALNPDTRLTCIGEKLTTQSLHAISQDIDIVVDATDNFSVRYTINDYCFEKGIPLVSGAAIRFEGQVSVFDPRQPESPCYRCLYPETKGADTALNCAESGVAAPMVGIIGCIQAMEVMKLITGTGEALTGWVQYLDASIMDWRKLRLTRRKDCLICSHRATA